jgi:signal peptidase
MNWANIPVMSRATVSVVEEQLLLTKGDNNPVDDLELYNGLKWLERQHIVGKVRGYV